MSGIGEERQIALKQQLIKFRESVDNELVFPSTLSNLERKYIHRVATELGLVSGSVGKGADRFITVQRKVVLDTEEAKKNPVNWTLSPKSIASLKDIDIDSVVNELKK
eukprot:gene46471-56906_t